MTYLIMDLAKLTCLERYEDDGSIAGPRTFEGLQVVHNRMSNAQHSIQGTSTGNLDIHNSLFCVHNAL